MAGVLRCTRLPQARSDRRRQKVGNGDECRNCEQRKLRRTMNKTRSLLLVAAACGVLAFGTVARADSTLVIDRQITSLTNIPFNGLGASERTIITFDQSPLPSLDLGNYS